MICMDQLYNIRLTAIVLTDEADVMASAADCGVFMILWLYVDLVLGLNLLGFNFKMDACLVLHC